MPAKKKTRSNRKKSKTFAASKRPVERASKKKLTVAKKARKNLAMKKAAQRTAAATTNAKRGKTTPLKTRRDIEQQLQDKNQDAVRSSQARQARVSSGRQSGDLQGLSRVEEANSESVDELLEEGNPFEAEVVTGVEEADEADPREVRTHEVPEDDVPDEYLDK
jgi:hypothetical protein